VTEISQRRPWTFYALAGFFVCYVLFIYGPMFIVFVLSFQGPNGGLTFPIEGLSLHWYYVLLSNARASDMVGALERSIGLAVIVMAATLLLSMMAGWAYRQRFLGSAFLFYTSVISLVIPGLLVGLGIGLTTTVLGYKTAWYTTALGAQLTWTLPFGLLIMFAIFSRFDPIYEEVAADLGASAWQRLRYVVIPILFPGLIAVGLFGFTLSYDEFARSMLTTGTDNTLPVEIWTLLLNVTTPALYAIGTMTTALSLLVIAGSFGMVIFLSRKRQAGSARQVEG
jgi:putative spermidine/putrescine transport system permease protein